MGDSLRHAEELTGVSQRMILAEPVQADKCINKVADPVCQAADSEEIHES